MSKCYYISAFTLCVFLTVEPVLNAQSPCVPPTPASDPTFEPGQVWAYHARPNESDSKITILRIEKTAKLGTIIHVRIDGIHFSNCTGGRAPTSLAHAPFSRAALLASVTKKVGAITPLPNYSEGYRDWLSHCGGIYTIAADQVVSIDDRQFMANLGCQ